MLASRSQPTRLPSSIVARRSARPLLTGSLLFGLSLSVVACDGGQGQTGETEAAPQSSTSSSSPSVSAESPSIPLGAASLDGQGETNQEKVSLEARYTPRAKLLEQLSTQYGFKILGRASSEARIDIDVDEVSLEAALAVLLAGEPYALQYAASSGLGRSVELVLLGDTEQHLNTLRRQRMTERRKAKNQGAAKERKREQTGRQEMLAALSEEGREAFLEREREEKAERQRQTAEIARTQLYSADPHERVRAIEHLDKDTISEDELGDIARSDPDGGVRASAVDRMGKSETAEAEDVVLSALDDPDPRVVIEAIDALEWKDRRSDIPTLEPLLSHANKDVRAAAESAIDFLRF